MKKKDQVRYSRIPGGKKIRNFLWNFNAICITDAQLPT